MLLYFPIHSRLYSYELSALFCINLFTLFTSYSQQIRMFFSRPLANFDSIKAALLLYGNVNETLSWYKFLQQRKTFATIQVGISICKNFLKSERIVFSNSLALLVPIWVQTCITKCLLKYFSDNRSSVETKIEVASNSIVTQD